jgi:drug/metabolite transporter (DMT)-like permease
MERLRCPKAARACSCGLFLLELVMYNCYRMYPTTILIHFALLMSLPKILAVSAFNFYHFHDRPDLTMGIGSIIVISLVFYNLFRKPRKSQA